MNKEGTEGLEAGIHLPEVGATMTAWASTRAGFSVAPGEAAGTELLKDGLRVARVYENPSDPHEWIGDTIPMSHPVCIFTRDEIVAFLDGAC